MDHSSYEIRYMPQNFPLFKQEAQAFWAKFSLRPDLSLTQYFGVYQNNRMIAGGGFAGRVIRGVAVSPAFRGEGVLEALISHVTGEMRQRGIINSFVFTKPDNQLLFEGLGFSPVEKTPSVLWMESAAGSFSAWLSWLEQFRRPGVTGCVVLKGDPFTLGHRCLLEEAAARCDHLILFVTSEGVCAIPFTDRLRLAREGAAHLRNVRVIPAGDYMIPYAAFPSCFLKNPEEAAAVHAGLDLRIFGAHVAPALGVTVRFAGGEPSSPPAALYQEEMENRLPAFGIKVAALPADKGGGKSVSPSYVRRLLAEGKRREVKNLLPEATYRYLLTPAGEGACRRLRQLYK